MKRFLLLNFLIGLLAGFILLPNQQREKSEIPVNKERRRGFILNSGETLIIHEAPPILHSGFSPDDYRQEIVQEAYKLGGLEFLTLIECENGLRDPLRVGDAGKSHGLCQLNTRRHKEPLSSAWSDWRNQLSVCYSKRKGGTKFYGPQRKIRGKRCGEIAKKRFMVAEDFTLVD